MNINKFLIVSALFTGVLGGCAVSNVGSVGPGSKASDTPPKIITDAEKRNIWDDPGAFGPVPAELKARGLSTCVSSGFKEAIGYHPQAKGLDGKPFVGGGFLCSGEPNK